MSDQKDFRRWTKRRAASGGWFICFNAYLKFMSIEAAWVLQRLINLSSSRPKTPKREALWNKGWTMCTVNYLEKLTLLKADAQKRILKELQGYRKGVLHEELRFVKTRRMGRDGRRFVKINLVKIEQALDAAEVGIAGNPPDRMKGNPAIPVNGKPRAPEPCRRMSL